MQSSCSGYEKNNVLTDKLGIMSTSGEASLDASLNGISERDKPKIRPNSLLAKLAVPCQTVADYDYGECYSYYANGCYNTCQFVDVGDIEDFMNNEKRKEKSRDAARSRRSKETEIFSDLGNTLPITPEQVTQLDKASIMRLAISYLKVRDMVSLVPELKSKSKEENPTDSLKYLKSLEGFILALSPDGDFVYISENVSDYLGISQIDLMGQNVFEYCHPCDHEEIRETLSGKTQGDCIRKSLFLRLKCTLTSKGRSVNLKSATYKIIHCTGHLVKDQKKSQAKDNADKACLDSCFIALGKPIPHPSNIETPLPKQTFLTKHSMDMKFTHADDDFMTKLLGYEPDDLLGKSVYEYHHAMDMDLIISAFKCLFSKGQCETNRYRFLAKSGGYVWVVTQATLIQDKMQKPQSVVCVNYVLSGLECKGEIYSASQFAAVKAEQAVNNNNNTDNNCVKISSPPAQIVPELVVSVVDDKPSRNIASNNKASSKTKEEPKVVQQRNVSVRKPVSSTAKLFGFVQKDPSERPQANTSKIFGPRTRDMNKGFLMFSDEAPGQTMLKDEPDDLTHLAPVAGDVCVPLEDNPLLNDMFDDILLRDNFAPLLLADEPPADPFISYRDFQDPSPQLLSPNLSKHSDCSLPSLNSPSDSLVDDDQITTFMNLQMEDDPDLLFRAPYIPMNGTDDLPLLMSNDLMWSSNEKKHHHQIPENSSSLAQLLSTSMNKHILKSNDHGGGLIQEQATINDLYSNEKNVHKSWTSNNKNNNHNHTNNNTNSNNTSKTAQIGNKIERTPSIKRPNTSINDHNTSKRTKNEPKEKMSSELLQQLMSNNHNRGRPKGKSNWLLESTNQKAACISQPSDSVLMNLLDEPMESEEQSPPRLTIDVEELKKTQIAQQEMRRQQIRKNSLSLLDPEATSLASFMDLTQQDYEVNAPVSSSSLLQGQELLKALEINTAI